MFKFFKIAFRNVFRQKKRTFSLGITYSFVTLLLVVLFSFSAGAVKNITNNISISIMGHLNIFGIEKNNGKLVQILKNYENINKTVKEIYPDVSIYPRFSENIQLYYNGYTKRLMFKGIVPELETKFASNLKFIKGSYEKFKEQKENILITKEDADYFSLKVGDEIVASIQTIYGAYNTGIFRVAGIYRSSNIFASIGVVAHHDYLAQLKLMPKGSTQLLCIYFKKAKNLDLLRNNLIKKLNANGIFVEKPDPSLKSMPEIMKSLITSDLTKPKIIILTIDEVLSQLSKFSTAVNSIGIVIGIIMFFIIGIALFVNIKMSINDRMREIGTLRTIGLKRKQLVNLLILENVILGIIFTFLGIILGILTTFIISLFKITNENLSVFLTNNHFYFYTRPLDLLIMFIIIVLFSIIFSYFPSRYAGKIDPVEALRKEF